VSPLATPVFLMYEKGLPTLFRVLFGLLGRVPLVSPSGFPWGVAGMPQQIVAWIPRRETERDMSGRASVFFHWMLHWRCTGHSTCWYVVPKGPTFNGEGVRMRRALKVLSERTRSRALRSLVEGDDLVTHKRRKALLGSIPRTHADAFLARWHAGNMPDLLGSNPKVAKGRAKRYATSICHLAPADLSGFNTCAMWTPGCRAACLNSAGRGGINLLGSNGLADKCLAGADLVEQIRSGAIGNDIQRARIVRTVWFFVHRESFMARLVKEIENAIKRETAKGYMPVFRLNGTSDISWEHVACTRAEVEYPSVMAAFPEHQFYDYTKRCNRKGLPANYHLTFSLAESNRSEAREARARGLNVAVVLRLGKKSPIPSNFNGDNMVDGDADDLRFLDASGYVGLHAKGKARRDRTGFVYNVEDTF